MVVVLGVLAVECALDVVVVVLDSVAVECTPIGAVVVVVGVLAVERVLDVALLNACFIITIIGCQIKQHTPINNQLHHYLLLC